MKHQDLLEKIACFFVVLFFSSSLSWGQTVSEEARRHMMRGEAAVEIARTWQDYEIAIQEFKQAAKFAPDWPEIYYNLGVVQQKVKLYGEAIENLNRYLELAPNATDADAVRDLIYKIEFLKERGWSKEDLVETWVGPKEAGSLTIGLRKPGSEPRKGTCGEFVVTSSNAQHYHSVRVCTAEFDGKRLQIGLRYFREDRIGQVFPVAFDSYDLTMVSRGRMTGTVKITKRIPKYDKRGVFLDKFISSRTNTHTGEWLRR